MERDAEFRGSMWDQPDPDTKQMVVCEACGGDGHFDQVVGCDPSGPVLSDSFCTACQGAGEYAVKREPVTIDDLETLSN